MAQHTPGPWRAERLRLDGHEWFVKSDCRNLPPYNWVPRVNIKIGALAPMSGEYVNSLNGSGSSDVNCCALAISENAANAYLIASAPELLDALKMLVADVGEYEAWQRPCHALDVAIAAIAKAQGFE